MRSGIRHTWISQTTATAIIIFAVTDLAPTPRSAAISVQVAPLGWALELPGAGYAVIGRRAKDPRPWQASSLKTAVRPGCREGRVWCYGSRSVLACHRIFVRLVRHGPARKRMTDVLIRAARGQFGTCIDGADDAAAKLAGAAWFPCGLRDGEGEI
jgi:hypothetical protein